MQENEAVFKQFLKFSCKQRLKRQRKKERPDGFGFAESSIEAQSMIEFKSGTVWETGAGSDVK